MNEVYDRMVQYAYSLVESVLKEYKKGRHVAFFPLLIGMGNLVVEHNGQGHNSYAVIDAINQYYDNTKDKDVIDGYETGILTMIKVAKNVKTLNDTVDVILYQCKIEKSGEAKFIFDREKIVEAFNNHMKENFEEFSKMQYFSEWHDELVEFAKEKYDIDFV